MIVQVDSQPVTNQYMWYMCCINNSISVFKRSQNLEHMRRHTMSTSMLVCPPPFLYLWSLPVQSLLVDLQSHLFVIIVEKQKTSSLH